MITSEIRITGYRISDKLYDGVRTIVYRGYREADSLPVVIKVLNKSYPNFSEIVQFRNQYIIAKNLNSPLIIQTYSLEPYENGYILVMEDFGGISLKDYCTQKNHLLSIPEFLEIAISLSDTLDFLYRHDVIHKDIKPANILINPTTRQLKLIDFSIASLLPRENQSLKNSQVLSGTLSYLSPEQTGRMNRVLDYRTDFYSLGVTFYELLTGILPFQSDDVMELVHCHLARTPKPVSHIQTEIPQVLSDIINKLMAKNAEDRYQSALGLKYDLVTCLEQIKETGKIKDFKIAQKDIGDRFTIPEKLYGREQEVKQLLEIFARVANPNQSNRAELILVAGFSGIGKTAVINEIHKPIVKQRGYFITGKFDQLNRNIPFSGFVQAFRDLIRQLITENEVQIQEWKSQILQALGTDGQVMIDVIPELEIIIGQQPPATELSGTSAQNRFNLLLTRFLQVFANKEHTLVIFLDDLQWADSASLKLIKLLMCEANQGYLLLIGAYRDNEVFPAHPLTLTLDEISKFGAIVNTINLRPLSQLEVNQLVVDTLKCVQDLAFSLSKLVYQKTQGNPFFTIQVLKSLHQDGLIQFDKNERCWQCDMSQINQHTLTDDIVKFMVWQLHKLPESTQKVLKLAACIGHKFDLETLTIISQLSKLEVASALWKALQAVFILPQSEIYKFYVGEKTEKTSSENDGIVVYKFLHDRVQQAAYSLIPKEEKQVTHYHIGQLLLKQFSPGAREEHIFVIVNQLNYGVSLIKEQSERNELAQLNLIACRKAKTATAYQSASEYANMGLSLLGEQAWKQQYKMSLELHELATEVAFLCGNWEQMEQLIDVVIAQTKSLLEQVNVYLIRIQAKINRTKFVEAISITQQLLKQLGITFPELITPQDIAQEVEEIRQLIGSRKIADLVHLPMMRDGSIMAIVKIINSIIPTALRISSPLLPLLILLGVKLCIQYGNTSASSTSYNNYGIILCSGKLQDIDTAIEFGQLALQVNLKLEDKAVKAQTLCGLGIFILHRKYHIRETLSILQDAYIAGLEVGNLEPAGYAAQYFCLNSFWCGQLLVSLEKITCAYREQMIKLNELSASNNCQIFWQAILNLLDLSEHPSILAETALAETEFLNLLLSTNNFYGLYFFYLYKLTLCFWFGEIESAKNYAVEARSYLIKGITVGIVSEPVFYFYDSLVALAQLSPDTNTDTATFILEQVANNQSQLEHWAQYAPMNHQHKVDLVLAEKYRVLGKKYAAGDYYDRAILGAKENGYIQEEALANELAAKFYLDWGREKNATLYMQEAYYCYARWGAKAKADDLERRYPQLIKLILEQQPSTLTSTFNLGGRTSSLTETSIINSSAGSTSDFLDFTSILKAAQTISSSIELDQLIANLTKIIVENSGADKSVLILLQGDIWQVRAITSTNSSAQIETILHLQPLNTCEDIPSKIIYYVINTQQAIVMDNCQTDIPGVIGRYFLEHEPKSVLCIPIIHQGYLVGVLYLENKLTSSIFTNERLQVINLLAAQAAISLENARLYQQAQQALEDLQQAQLKIVQSEKMSALGNLVAGVAHEMNNPLGFISASLLQAKPTLVDIMEHLKLYQESLPDPSESILNHAESIDLDYSLEDLPKMVDSMILACDRLKNISTSLRTFSRADKEYKVKFNIHEGIDSTILILKHRLKANNERPEIEIVTTYGDLPQIKCFPGQLNQVFMNILANAIDAIDESSNGRSFAEIQANPPRIIVKTSAEDNQVIKISIADNAKGMSEEVKQRIFDHLFTTKAVGKGTGLGLAIAKQIVEETHGGNLSCNSVLGKGTEFVIAIPV